ncbi:MAG: hypothetical protein ACTSRW_10735 [Candidatus Helarchaeota archaeon]
MSREKNAHSANSFQYKIHELIGKQLFNINLQAEVFMKKSSRQVRTKDRKIHVVNEYILIDDGDDSQIVFSIWDDELPVGEWVEINGAYTQEWNGEFRLSLSRRGRWKPLDLLNDENTEFQAIASIPFLNNPINVQGHVVEIEEPRTQSEKILQRILIGDETAVIVVHVTDKHVNKFQEQLHRFPQSSDSFSPIGATLINAVKTEVNSSLVLLPSSRYSIKLDAPGLNPLQVNLDKNITYPDLNV